MEDTSARRVQLAVKTIGFISQWRILVEQVVDRKAQPGSVKSRVVVDRVRNRKVGKKLVVDPVEIGIWIIRNQQYVPDNTGVPYLASILAKQADLNWTGFPIDRSADAPFGTAVDFEQFTQPANRDVSW